MPEDQVISIDGSTGEGGGQIIRTALALSVITGKPFSITAIRAGRREPGLKEQHLTCIEAARAISQASVTGNTARSPALSFFPGKPRAGSYHFAVETAGSASLVLHSIFYPLALLDRPSQLSIKGGTHVFWSPTFDYLSTNWAFHIKSAGFRAGLDLVKTGYFPRGRGEISCTVGAYRDSASLPPVRKLSRGVLTGLSIIIGSSHLPDHVRRRMKATVKKVLGARLSLARFIEITPQAESPNAFICITAKFDHTSASFTDVGERGKPSEEVAENACRDFLSYLERRGALDLHMADQILLPLCLVPRGTSVYTTTHVTSHLLTNREIIMKFLPVSIEIEGKEHEEGKVTVKI
ncbi:MAG: RNA 3'-terminal phosphate cyclase [Candidatus Eremiobacteraeota bacterium]|nr:RNA 3'-terminal phosphate cyclase [Candidatus Eremiobacteraeota bacterium]